MVIVDVRHPDAGVNLLGDLVNIAGSGDASTDVNDLPDTDLADQVADYALQERPVLPRYIPGFGQRPQDSCCCFPVDYVVVLPAR
jgi:hypothetical protein